MTAQERNELDEYSDLMDAAPIHDRDPDADRDNRLDAEWLEGQQDAAYLAAKDAGMFQEQGCLYTGNLISDCDSLRSTILQAASDHVFLARLDADFRREFGDGKNKDAEREQACGGYYSTMARGGDEHQ